MPRSFTALLFFVALAAAAGGAPLITGNAVGQLRVGMPASTIASVANVKSDRLEPDSEGGQIRVVRVAIAGSEVAAEVYEGRVWRLKVAHPGLSTSSGVGVGSSLSKLLALGKVEVQVAGAALYVLSSQLCGVSFRLSHELKTDKDFLINWDVSTLAALPATVSVHSMLVTGCTK